MLILLLSTLAFAEDFRATAPPPPAAPAAAPIVYELRDLKPEGITQYNGSGDALRQYYEFKNEQGSHHVVYEEVGSAPPLRTVTALRQASTAFDSFCTMDIECATKAFCTGDCKNMYYEVANAPGDTFSPDRNKCKILFFSCEKTRPPAPAPIPAIPVKQ